MDRSKALAVVGSILFIVTNAEAETRSLRDVLTGTVLEAHAGDVANGERVTVEDQLISEREMAVALACLIPQGRKGSLARFQNARPIVPDEYRGDSGPIDPDDPEAGFVNLTTGSDAEAQRYIDAEPGWELSLSADEISAFRSIDRVAADKVTSVDEVLRRVLSDRVRAYHTRGLEGIAPFDRGSDGSSSVASDLKRSTIGTESFRKVLPQTHAALLKFPFGGVPGGRKYYFWTRMNVLGRPVFLLNQRLAAELDGASVVIERQFYATQFLAGGQTVTALVPVKEGELLVYVNHSFVDRWQGFGVSAKKAIGRTLLEKTLSDMAEKYGLCEGTG